MVGAHIAIHAATLLEWWLVPTKSSIEPPTATLLEWCWGPIQPSMQAIYLNGGGDSVLSAERLPHSQLGLHSRMQPICMVVRTYRQKYRIDVIALMTSSMSSLISWRQYLQQLNMLLLFVINLVSHKVSFYYAVRLLLSKTLYITP